MLAHFAVSLRILFLCSTLTSLCVAQRSADWSFPGVSLAGAEFGADSAVFSNTRPGRVEIDYTFPDQRTIEYFSRHGVKLLRIPFRWERVQPKLGGKLDRSHVEALRRVCRLAQRFGCRVLLDVHNYGRYRVDQNGRPRTCVIDEAIDGSVPVSRHHFADLWRRLAQEFRQENGVVAYGLMNEPHDMGSSDWKAISQRAVDAVRSVDRVTRVVVAGDQWSSAEHFLAINGTSAWIRDPTDKTIYEAHCYFDHDGSGKYALSFEDELRRDSELLSRGADRVRPSWNGVVLTAFWGWWASMELPQI